MPKADIPLLSWRPRRVCLELERKGVEILDLLPAFLGWRAVGGAPDESRSGPGKRLYLDTDVHWSSTGASLAAEVIAERIKQYPWFSEVERVMGRALLVERELSCELRGSITKHYVRFGRMAGPVPLERTTVHTVRISGEAKILGQLDPGSPILVIGDSLTALFSFHTPCISGQRDAGAGLPDHLLRVLGFRVDVIASPGGGVVASRKALAGRSNGLAGTRLVVYVIASRALTAPGSRWELVDLGGPRPR